MRGMKDTHTEREGGRERNEKKRERVSDNVARITHELSRKMRYAVGCNKPVLLTCTQHEMKGKGGGALKCISHTFCRQIAPAGHPR